MPKTTRLSDETYRRAYDTVEQMLKDAVEGADTHQQFNQNLAFCQIVSTRMLSILIFNSFMQNQELGAGDEPLKTYVDRAFDGVRQELQSLAEDFEKNGAEVYKSPGGK